MLAEGLHAAGPATQSMSPTLNARTRMSHGCTLTGANHARSPMRLKGGLEGDAEAWAQLSRGCAS